MAISNMLNNTLIIIFILSFAVIMFYMLFFRMRLALRSNRTNLHHPVSTVPVSVVICAKNEEENLKINLPFILSQNYPDFEVVVVDDHSDDETFYVLKSFQNQYSNLQVIRLNENVNFFSGKKFPLSIGIRSAKNPYLLLTDADCRPVSVNWIRLMSAGFAHNRQIVLGYGKYENRKGFLNRLISFETLYTAMQYFSFALSGMPYMGVGRNLAYTRQLFSHEKGFSKHYNIASGDDDLFVNSTANKDNVSCVIHPDAYTVSTPPTNWKSWWKQKRRHLTTGRYYKTKHKILLSLYPLVFLIFFMTLIFLLKDKNNFYLVFSLLSVKVILGLFIYKKLSEKFGEGKIYLFSLFFELILVLVFGIIFLVNSLSKQRKWK
jgi:poly-beta-1,6-N-acetyl-D-glucosamine synthase